MEEASGHNMACGEKRVRLCRVPVCGRKQGCPGLTLTGRLIVVAGIGCSQYSCSLNAGIRHGQSLRHGKDGSL